MPDAIDRFEFRKEFFGENNLNNSVHTAEIQNQLALTPHAVTDLRDITITSGSGSVSFSNGEYDLTTTANGSDSVALETGHIGQYRPGLIAECGIYVRKDSDPVGFAEWGYGRDGGNDQIFFRYNSDGSFELVVESGGTETVISESDWDSNTTDKDINDESGNHAGTVTGFDAMDGSGQSGINLDAADGYIWKVEWSWYGGGSILWSIVEPGRSGYNRPQPIVLFTPQTRISIEQPNQPIFCRLDNDGTATSDSAVVAGRQFSFFGTPKFQRRQSEELVEDISVGTSDTTAILFRRDSDHPGVAIDVLNMAVSTDQQLHGYLRVNPSLSSSASWSTPTNHSSSETAIEVDSSTSITSDTGVKYGGFMIGSGKNESAFEEAGEFEFPLLRQNPNALIMRSLTGSSATVDLSIAFEERW